MSLIDWPSADEQEWMAKQEMWRDARFWWMEEQKRQKQEADYALLLRHLALRIYSTSGKPPPEPMKYPWWYHRWDARMGALTKVTLETEAQYHAEVYWHWRCEQYEEEA